MIKRHFEPRLRQLLGTFPIVTILGPRQCGKTSFVKATLPEWKYFDMEKPSQAAPFIDDPEHRLKQIENSFILDEAQQIPALFPVLRGFIDEVRQKKGRAILLGSASPSLVRIISESLAGRTGFLEMSPFHFHEVGGEINRLWFRGGYPDAYQAKNNEARGDWYDAYTRTFIERDLKALGIDISSNQMRKLWAMLAHANGAVWNASQLASSLGVSYHTVNHYTDILEQTFLIRKLHPYYTNVGKRLLKSPKVYFRDTGLLHYFLGITKPEMLDVHPSRGLSWESFVLNQLIWLFELFEPRTEFYYWRTAAGAEVDFLIKRGSMLTPIEIKLSSSVSRDQVRGLISCMKDLKIKKGYVLYPGKDNYSIGEGISVLSVEKILSNPKEAAKLR